MICKVENTIKKYKLLCGVESVAVGVSGGADSMCLLHILSLLKDKYGITVKAVHINHNIRGEEAMRDESFVRDFCKKNDICLTVFNENIPELSKQMCVGTEECGRTVRYRCFQQMNCDAIALAHSLSDSIETALFNFARGTSLKGLCGIPAKREPNIIRPLIECTRKEIEQYCELNGVSFITDSSNLSDDYMRNHIRHNLVPAVSRINQNYENNFLRCFSSLSDDEDFLSGESLKLLYESKTDAGYNIDILSAAHPSVRKRTLALILKANMKKSIENKHIELLNEIILKKEGKFEIAHNFYIATKNSILYLQNATKIQPCWKSDFVSNKAETPVGFYSLEKGNVEDKCAIDKDKICHSLLLSSRLEGDKFTFKSRGITKSLKKLFNEMKIPAEQRNLIPVLHDGEKVVWIEGIGVNADYIPDKNSKNIIIIKKEG